MNMFGGDGFSLLFLFPSFSLDFGILNFCHHYKIHSENSYIEPSVSFESCP